MLAFPLSNPLQTLQDAHSQPSSPFCRIILMRTLSRPFLSFLCLLLLIPSPLLAKQKDRLEDILRREGIKHYKVTIRNQSRKWLIREFGPGKKYPINVTLAIKNLVWQAREHILKGKRNPVQGKIRTFWYTDVKTVLARTGSLNPKTEQSDTLHKVLVELVGKYRIMRYKDMGFHDHNAASVRIGHNWHVMLIGEKHGKFVRLNEIARELKCTMFTLGGQPSLLSMEYLVDDYKERDINIQKSMYLIFMVDYDPAGSIIRNSVIRDLAIFGVKHTKPINIVSLDILTPEELELVKYPISPDQDKLDEWLEETGGINGEPYGFGSDSVPFERLRRKIIDEATPFVGNPEIIRRANAYDELWQALNELIQARLGLDTK